MLDSYRNKNEGKYRTQWGGGKKACLVTPDLSYAYMEGEENRDENGIKYSHHPPVLNTITKPSNKLSKNTATKEMAPLMTLLI